MAVKVARKNWRFVRDSKARRNLLVGGANSSKSYTVAQHLILNHFCKDRGIGIMVCCKTLPSVRLSAMTLILRLLRDYELPFEFNKSELRISNDRGNWILFKSLDNPEKLKSIEEVNFVWVEESTEITHNDYLQLNLRCRHVVPGVLNQLYFTFNPVDFNSFLRGICADPPDDTAACQSTFRDNPFLPKREREVLEQLVLEDDAHYRIYNLGEWCALKGVIYDKWDIVPVSAWPTEYQQKRLGLDFGYSGSETALVHVRRRDRELWVRQLIYEKRLTTPALISRMREIGITASIKNIADCERPDDIDEILMQNFDIHPCHKGPGSVKSGIDRMQRFTIHILADSPDIEREIKGYHWKLDKNGDPLGVPVAYKDHLLDALRYAVSDMEVPVASTDLIGSEFAVREKLQERLASDVGKLRLRLQRLGQARPAETALVCQAVLKHPTPEVITLLRELRGNGDARVAARCDDMLDILSATGKM